MALTRLHTTGALVGAAVLAVSWGFGGSAQAAPDTAGAVGMQATTAVAAAQAGAAMSGRVQGVRLVGATAAVHHRRGTTPAPTKDRRQITKAVKHSQLTSAVDPSDYRVRDIRLAKTNPAWAAAMIKPSVPLDPAAVLLHHVHGHWKVATLGTAQVGCGLAPSSVLQDFRSYASMGNCD